MNQFFSKYQNNRSTAFKTIFYIKYSSERGIRMAARGLGKGIDTLIPVKSKTDNNTKTEVKYEGPVKIVKITKIEPDREQPRKHFDEDALLELSESIKQHGLLQPLMLQDCDDQYEIIAG